MGEGESIMQTFQDYFLFLDFEAFDKMQGTFRYRGHFEANTVFNAFLQIIIILMSMLPQRPNLKQKTISYN